MPTFASNKPFENFSVLRFFLSFWQLLHIFLPTFIDAVRHIYILCLHPNISKEKYYLLPLTVDKWSIGKLYSPSIFTIHCAAYNHITISDNWTKLQPLLLKIYICSTYVSYTWFLWWFLLTLKALFQMRKTLYKLYFPYLAASHLQLAAAYSGSLLNLAPFFDFDSFTHCFNFEFRAISIWQAAPDSFWIWSHFSIWQLFYTASNLNLLHLTLTAAAHCLIFEFSSTSSWQLTCLNFEFGSILIFDSFPKLTALIWSCSQISLNLAPYLNLPETLCICLCLSFLHIHSAWIFYIFGLYL